MSAKVAVSSFVEAEAKGVDCKCMAPAATAGAFDAGAGDGAKSVAACTTGASDDSVVLVPDDGEADTTTTLVAEGEDCSVSALPS